VLWPLCGTDAYASLLTAASGRPCCSATSSFVDRDVGRWALDLMHSVASRSDRRCLAMNPIATLDAMSRTDYFTYCPLTFCYVNYSRADAVGKRITFGDIPAVSSGAPAVREADAGGAAGGGPIGGALLGGAD
jgi:multiple sugar transport system substrate-binding protein